MEAETLQKYLEAGKIASSIRKSAKEWARPGVTLLELAEKIEGAVTRSGAALAFPVNLSLNEFAAHYTPSLDETTAIKEGDLLKVDIGVHIDGFVADTAFTVCFSPQYDFLVKAVDSALDSAIKLCKPGITIAEISEAIEQAIRFAGAVPISNLTGHGLTRFDIHAEPPIPNIKVVSNQRLAAGQVIAIEPFATTPQGAGYVKDSEHMLIFRLVAQKPVRNQDARKISALAKNLEGLPFARRWIERDLKLRGFKLNLALKELIDREAVEAFPALREAHGQPVAQAEHTIIVDNPSIVTTK
ncbi:MAG: type II methionyl aminopeptidase [Candidatus Aenigmatarchaeota archaeon]